MPIVAIPPDLVGPPGDRAIVTFIEAWMLFPDDAALRDLAMSYSAGQLFLCALKGGAIAPDDIALDALADAPRHAEIVAAVKLRFHYGIAAGKYLMEALDPSDGKLLRNLQTPREAVAALLECSAATMKNAVRKHAEPVGHYFAAYLASGDAAAFPCRPDGVAAFLASAEQWRRRGERTATNATRPDLILKAGRAIVLWPPPALRNPR